MEREFKNLVTPHLENPPRSRSTLNLASLLNGTGKLKSQKALSLKKGNAVSNLFLFNFLFFCLKIFSPCEISSVP